MTKIKEIMSNKVFKLFLYPFDMKKVMRTAGVTEETRIVAIYVNPNNNEARRKRLQKNRIVAIRFLYIVSNMYVLFTMYNLYTKLTNVTKNYYQNACSLHGPIAKQLRKNYEFSKSYEEFENHYNIPFPNKAFVKGIYSQAVSLRNNQMNSRAIALLNKKNEHPLIPTLKTRTIKKITNTIPQSFEAKMVKKIPAIIKHQTESFLQNPLLHNFGSQRLNWKSILKGKTQKTFEQYLGRALYSQEKWKDFVYNFNKTFSNATSINLCEQMRSQVPNIIGSFQSQIWSIFALWTTFSLFLNKKVPQKTVFVFISMLMQIALGILNLYELNYRVNTIPRSLLKTEQNTYRMYYNNF